MAHIALGHKSIDLTSDWGTHKNPWQGSLAASIPMTMDKLGYRTVADFGSLRGYINPALQKVWIEVHPLWQESHAAYRQARSEAAARHSGFDIGMLNPFRALRRPSDYV